jgi:hypothetical protein
MRNKERILKKERKIIGLKALPTFVGMLSVGTKICATVCGTTELRRILKIELFEDSVFLEFITDSGDKRFSSMPPSLTDNLNNKTYIRDFDRIVYRILK